MYQQGRAMQEIGIHFGVSRQRICQIIQRARWDEQRRARRAGIPYDPRHIRPPRGDTKGL